MPHDRILFSMQRTLNRSVAILDRAEWNRMVDNSGTPTFIDAAGIPIHAVAREATVVAIAGSGIVNPQPGIDVVRYDPQDRPFVYNIDHYRVVENLPSHPRYEDIVRTAGVRSTPEVRQFMSQHVFIVGPERPDNHWVEEIPAAIAAAKPVVGSSAEQPNKPLQPTRAAQPFAKREPSGSGPRG
jgi:hypothetical protein